MKSNKNKTIFFFAEHVTYSVPLIYFFEGHFSKIPDSSWVKLKAWSDDQ